MKRLIHALLLSSLMLMAVNEIQAQRSGDTEELSPFWFGGGFNLGFSGGNGQTVFNFGLSPMVGYRLFDQFSVGPRVALLYTNYTIRGFNGGDNANASPISWAVGLFGRYKVPLNTRGSIFAHIEAELENEAFVQFVGNDLEVFRREVGNFYIGGGYSAGFPFAYEIYGLYNLNQRDVQFGIENPIEIRLGFTYNF